MFKLMVIPHPLGRTGFNDVRHAVLVVQRQDTNKPLELWECEWQDWRTNNIPAHFGLLPYLVYMLWLWILYALSSGYLFLAAAYPWIIPMFDSFNFKAKSQGGHLMPVVVGWCHHAVHARSMAGKYLRVSQTRDRFNGRQIRQICEKGFSIAHMDFFWFWSWASYNSPRNHVVKPWKEGILHSSGKATWSCQSEWLGECIFSGDVVGKKTIAELNYQPFFGGLKKVFQMRSILKNFSMRCWRLTVWEKKTSEFGKGEFSWSNFMATTAFAMVFLANLALGGFPKSLTWNLSRLPIIQLPTCFFLSTAERVKHQIFHLEVCGSLTKNTYLTKHKLHWLKFGTTINKSKKLNPKNSKNGRVKLKSAVEL